jgi:mono/diheme cytochrome c family protein
VLAVVGLALWLQPDDPQPPPVYGATELAGRRIFQTVGCSSCHKLRDALATGVIGPDLDAVHPSRALVIDRVSHGQGVMPSFANKLTAKQITQVADYVALHAGR